MTQDELKALVGQAAIAYVEPGTVIGVGTGSTVNRFIDALGRMPVRIKGAVSSSQQSTARLQAFGIAVLDSTWFASSTAMPSACSRVERGSLPATSPCGR